MPPSYNLSPISNHSLTSAAALPGSSLLTLQTVLTALGFDDLKAGLQQAGDTQREQTALLIAALQVYAEQPDEVELAKSLLPLLQETIEQSQIEYQHVRKLQAQYEQEAKQVSTPSSTNSSYWQWGRDWVKGTLQSWLGTTAQDQATHYAEIAEKRQAQVAALQRLLTELQEQIAADEREVEQREETSILHVPQRRLLQASTPVTILNPVPDQVIEATVEYSYDLSNVFTGDYDQLRVTQANGSALPDWLNFEPKYLGSYDMPNSARGIQVVGAFVAYLVDGYSLEILNVSNPANITRLGGYDTPGGARDFQVIGTVAYVADWASGLQILDVSDPANITRLGGYNTPGFAHGVQVMGTVAYVADWASGLQILNVSNPANITYLGGYDTPGIAYGVKVISLVAYVADYDSGLQILNVSNLANITHLGGYDTPNAAYSVQVVGALAYVADAGSGLQILNVSNSENVTYLGGYDTPGNAYDVQVVGSMAYVADGVSGLQILDVSNPTNVILLGNYDTPHIAWGVQVMGTVVYVADGDSGLQILNLLLERLVGTATIARVSESYTLEVSAWSSTQWQTSDVFQLTVARLPRRVDTSLITQSVFPDHPLTLSWDSDILFTDVTGGVLRLSVALTNLTTAALPITALMLHPTVVGSYDTPSNAQSVQVMGMVAYVADGYSGLQILEVSNSATVTYLGRYKTPGIAQAVQVIGGIAYVADTNSGLQILNVSNPANVTYLGSYDTPGVAHAVQVVSTVAYVADYDFGLHILNVSNPANITLLGGYEMPPGRAYDVQVIGALAYVADDYYGSLQILNVSNSANVTRLGGYNTPGAAYGVQVVGTLAYVADGVSGLQILDVSNPTIVIPLGFYALPAYAWNVQIVGTIAYVANVQSGLQILDVSNPMKVMHLGSYDTPSSAHDIQVVGTLAYVADDYSGLQILDLTQWEFTVNPTSAEVGNYQVALTATNNLGGSASDSFLLRVEGPPQWRGIIPQQYAKVGQLFHYFISQGLVTDPNLDPVSFTAVVRNQTSLPSWLGFNGIAATFSGTPRSQDTGNYTIVLTATDHIAGSADIEFNLYVDHLPVLNRPIGQRVAGVGRWFNVSLPADTFIDQDQDILTFNATGLGGVALPSWLSFDTMTQRFVGTPGASDLGITSLEVHVLDPVGGEAQDHMTLIVEHFPQAGSAITSPVAAVGRPFVLTIPEDSFSDEDDPVLSLSAQLSSGDRLPQWLSFNSATRSLSGIPTSAGVGLLGLRILAQDSYGASAGSDFQVRITHPPQLSRPLTDQVIPIGTPYDYALPTDTFTDADGDFITYRLAAQPGETLPDWLNFNASSRVLSGLPNTTLSHRYPLTLIASDAYDQESQADFTLTADHFPEFVGVLTFPVFGVDQPLRWALPSGAFIDADGETLRYTLQRRDGGAAPSYLMLDSYSGTLTGAPSILDLGQTTLQLTAHDPWGATAVAPFTLTVVHTPQVVNPITPPPVIREGRLLNFTLGTDAFNDLDDPTLIYTAYLNDDQPLPAWLRFDNRTLRFTGDPQAADVGDYQIWVAATDQDGGRAQTDFHLTIEPNYPPEVHRPITTQIVEVLRNYRFVIPNDTITDRNQDSLTYSVRGVDGGRLPGWLQFDPIDRQLYGKPGRGDVNPFTPREFDLELTARDDRASVSARFHMVVQGESHFQLFLRIGAPLFTAFTTLLAIYRYRAVLLNRCRPQRYQKLSHTLRVGEHFEHPLDTPAEKIQHLDVRLPGVEKGCYCRQRFFRSPCPTRQRPLPGGAQLPSWMAYDMNQNRLFSKGPVPQLEDKQLTVRVKGAANVILEQFVVNVLPAEPNDPVAQEDKYPVVREDKYRDVEQPEPIEMDALAQQQQRPISLNL